MDISFVSVLRGIIGIAVVVSIAFLFSEKKSKIPWKIVGIGLLFQIADDLIDYSGSTKKAGKKTRKDLKKGKATLISLLGYKNTVKYGDKVKLDILNKIRKFGNKTKDLTDTINYILIRSKWKKIIKF